MNRMMPVGRYAAFAEVGPETRFGEMLRRSWVPACLSADVAEKDSDPFAVKLLGEDLVIFRDSEGRVGCLDEYCAHRTASLLLGRVEGSGIRCIYHGWKFGVDGTLMEAPNHPDPAFCKRVKQPAYPVEEAGGIVWIYMGPAESITPLPDYPFLAMPETNRDISVSMFDCNFIQALEGGLDTTHLGTLHIDAFTRMQEAQPEGMRSMSVFQSVVADVEAHKTEHGMDYVAIRHGLRDDGAAIARVTMFIAPWVICIAPGGLWNFFIPRDDVTTLFFQINFNAAPDFKTKYSAMRPGGGFDQQTLGAYGMTRDKFDTERADWSNHFKQDRAAMQAGTSYTGLPQVLPADYAMACSMGPVADRRRENLAPVDAPTTMMRGILLDSIDRVEHGEPAVGAKAKAYMNRLEAAEGPLFPGEDWKKKLVPDHVFV
jgi:phthalate 4,5-dioxygenase